MKDDPICYLADFNRTWPNGIRSDIGQWRKDFIARARVPLGEYRCTVSEHAATYPGGSFSIHHVAIEADSESLGTTEASAAEPDM